MIVRIILFVLMSMGLVGCAATTQDVAQQVQNRFIGQNVDALVLAFGPPTSSFKMNNGQTSYVWQLSSVTDINTYNGGGSASTYFCRINVIASTTNIVTQTSTQDATNGFGESLCAMRLGMHR
jgi:hypothetical protein